MSSAKDHPELLPIPKEQQTMPTISYTLMILSMAITTSIFFLGWFAQILGLNMLQTVVAATIGNTVVAIIMYLNGYVGVKYGIPFPVQLRPAFGYRGSIIPLLVRAIVSIFWYGIDGFIASWAITEMAMLIGGVPPDRILQIGLKYTPITFVFYLLFVWLVGYKKITKGIKWLDTVAGPLLLIFFAWFVYYLSTQPNLPGKMPSWTGGGVGWLSGAFFLEVAVQTAWWGTIALNVSDICRWNRNTSSLVWGHIFGLIIPQIIGTWLGYVATTLTAGTYSPIDIIAKYTPSAALGFFGLLFATLATGSTNATGDVPAATNAIIRITGWGWVTSLSVATFLAWLLIGPYSIVHWNKALEVAESLLLFNWYYSLWLGPIASVMVLDFWWLRKRKYDIEELYKRGPEGKYWYTGGINWVGLGSFIIGLIGVYIWAWKRHVLGCFPAGNTCVPISVFGVKMPVPGLELAWYYGFFIAAIAYIVLALAFKKYAVPELKE